MAKITNIFRRKNTENSVNHVIDSYATFTPVNIGCKRFADAYLQQILAIIFRGLRNVRYCQDEAVGQKSEYIAQLAEFLNINLQQLIWDAWQYGYIVITTDGKTWQIVPHRSVKIGSNREVQNYQLVTYTDAYRFLGKSDMEVIREHIDRLDRLVNADDYLTQSLGAMGILSGTSMGLTPQDKKDFLDGIKRNVGITSDKYQFIVMGSPVDFKQVALPIADLKLDDKVKEEVKLLAGYFGVPYDLLPISGASTYANQEQAVVGFYRNCIAPLAEVVLELGRYAIRKTSREMIPSRALTFTLDNVPELEADRDDTESKIERAGKLVEIISKGKAAGLDMGDYEKLLNG